MVSCSLGVLCFLAPVSKSELLIQDAGKASTYLKLTSHVGTTTPVAKLNLPHQPDERTAVDVSKFWHTLEDAKSLPAFRETSSPFSARPPTSSARTARAT